MDIFVVYGTKLLLSLLHAWYGEMFIPRSDVIFPLISPPTSYENEAASKMAKKNGFIDDLFSINIMIYSDSNRPRFDPFPYHLKRRLIA